MEYFLAVSKLQVAEGSTSGTSSTLSFDEIEDDDLS